MSRYTKEELNKKHLVELKVIAKELRMPFSGTKSQIINLILDATKPIVSTVNTHSHLGKAYSKIYGIKISDKENLTQNSKKIEEGRCKFLYYSLGFLYFSTDL